MTLAADRMGGIGMEHKRGHGGDLAAVEDQAAEVLEALEVKQVVVR